MISRRKFVSEVALAGTAAALGFGRELFAAEPPPETTRLRIAEIPSTCRSPEWIAGDLLRAEGFTDVQYTKVAGTVGVERALATGEADISAHFCAVVPNLRIMEIDIDSVAWRDELFINAPVIEDGMLIVPKGPGWGVDVNEEAVRAHPVKGS